MHHFYHSIVNFDVTRSLYIQALLAMQAANEYTDGLSYFQLAGEQFRIIFVWAWLAQNNMHAKPPSVLTWRFSVGIHGRPYVSWDGVNQTIGAPVTGYCTHGNTTQLLIWEYVLICSIDSVLFTTWHRPYLALFEVNLPEPSSWKQITHIPSLTVASSRQLRPKDSKDLYIYTLSRLPSCCW